MQEKLRMEVLTDLSINFDSTQLEMISNVLVERLSNYDVTRKSTEIVLYQEEIPVEVKEFLVCKSLKGLTKASLVHYKRTLVNFSRNITKNPKDITTNDVRLYMLHYEQTHNSSKASIDDIRRVLNSFFTWMLREEYILKNPMARIDPIKCVKKVREPLTDIELEQIRNACTTAREKAILELLYSTGCRVSEITALNKSDIDYTEGRVKVFGKGKKERFCFLNAKAQLALKKYLFMRQDDSEALFVSTKGPNKRLGKGTIEKEIGDLGIRAGIRKRVFPHRIRHTTATHMLAHGASLDEVQSLLGHASSQTTTIYAKTDLRNLQAVHQRCII